LLIFVASDSGQISVSTQGDLRCVTSMVQMPTGERDATRSDRPSEAHLCAETHSVAARPRWHSRRADAGM